MRPGLARALAFAGGVVCASCALDETGLAPTTLDGGRPPDVSLHDGTPASEGANDANDAKPPEDHSLPDAPGDHEAPADGGHPDVGPDSPHPTDAGVDSTGTDAPPSVSYRCGGGVTADCSASCAGRPVSCLYCSLLTGNAGFCGKKGRSCLLDTPPLGYVQCACLSTPDCAGDDQMCVTLGCLSCGEPGTEGRACKGGGKCDVKSAACM